jgi:hypothetical protein
MAYNWTDIERVPKTEVLEQSLFFLAIMLVNTNYIKE